MLHKPSVTAASLGGGPRKGVSLLGTDSWQSQADRRDLLGLVCFNAAQTQGKKDAVELLTITITFKVMRLRRLQDFGTKDVRLFV